VLSFAIASGPDGNLWFTEESTCKIRRITPSGTIAEFDLPLNSGNGYQLLDIASGPDGALRVAKN
jgi:virginiamycin B lyase